ncbi:DUF6783 domain-containing protein [Blautia sp. HCP3S3_H10_1]
MVTACCAVLNRTKSSTNCDAHLAESLLGGML